MARGRVAESGAARVATLWVGVHPQSLHSDTIKDTQADGMFCCLAEPFNLLSRSWSDSHTNTSPGMGTNTFCVIGSRPDLLRLVQEAGFKRCSSVSCQLLQAQKESAIGLHIVMRVLLSLARTLKGQIPEWASIHIARATRGQVGRHLPGGNKVGGRTDKKEVETEGEIAVAREGDERSGR